MFSHLNVENILFLDIETVPQYQEYSGVPPPFNTLWDKKASQISKNDDDSPESLYPRAGIYAEFGKIICISCGFIKSGTLRIKSFFGDDEKLILMDFSALLDGYFSDESNLLCAHNGKEFDFPYIARRMLINGVDIPGKLDIAGKKPWEVAHLDTMELWKFGDYKHYTSLELLTATFGIPTPKDDIKGSDVCGVYWEEKNLERIVEYCQKDVIAIVQLMRKYQNKELIDEGNIVVV